MLTLLLLGNNAVAWNHTGFLWNRDFFPLTWYMSDYISEEIDPGATDLESTYQFQVIQDSYENWARDASCAQISTQFNGIREDHYSTGRDSSDVKNTFYYNDPSDEQGAGVLGVTYTVSSGILAFTRDGKAYTYALDSDIVFSKDIPWIKSTEMETDCSGTPLEAVATHEIGHQLGMGHSCEEEDVTSGQCEEQDIKEANMFWSAPDCTTFRSSYNSGTIFTDDDVQGMTAIYGPYATFSATTATYGGVGLEVCFELNSDEEVSSVDWLFGDGTEENIIVDGPEDYTICHEYTEKGQYTINVTIRGASEDCGGGEWEYSDRKRAMVVVCEAPQVGEDFEGLFTIEPVEGKIYQMVNQADTSVYGCIDRVSWDIFDGDEKIRSVSAWSPKIEFPDYSDYRVVLNLGGPGGVTAEELTVTVAEESELGCSAMSNRGFGVFAVGLSLFGFALRRREQ